MYALFGLVIVLLPLLEALAIIQAIEKLFDAFAAVWLLPFGAYYHLVEGLDWRGEDGAFETAQWSVVAWVVCTAAWLGLWEAADRWRKGRDQRLAATPEGARALEIAQAKAVLMRDLIPPPVWVSAPVDAMETQEQAPPSFQAYDNLRAGAIGFALGLAGTMYLNNRKNQP